MPENTKTVDEITEPVKIDQVVIGSCTNGRLRTLEIAAKILSGRKVAKGLRVIVIPATQQIYMDAMAAGYLKTFIEAGAIVSTPTCGPCLGGYMGILAEHERCVFYNKPEFCGPHGPCNKRNLSCKPGSCGRQRGNGKNFRAGRIRIIGGRTQ